jgi:hypothetical protein
MHPGWARRTWQLGTRDDPRVRAVGFVCALLLLAASARGQAPPAEARPPLAAFATLAVRLVVDTDGQPTVVQQAAGFFVSPGGHVLTTYRAVGGTVTSDPAVTHDPLGGLPGRVEVVWAVPGSGQGPQAFEAPVLAASAEHDLALLLVTGVADVPYLPIGDSDAIVVNQSVRAYAGPPVRVPSTGIVLASGRPGRLRVLPSAVPGANASPWIKADAVPAGAVGGPLVDAEGFVVGVVQGEPAEGQPHGTVVPVNLARRLLEVGGASAALPPRLALRSVESYDAKGLRMQVAGELRDTWTGRARWQSAPDAWDLVLRIDRLLAALPTGQLETQLLAGALGDVPLTVRDPLNPEATGLRPVPAGRAKHYGSAKGRVGEVPYAMEYAILSLDREKVVARYLGRADVVAHNRSVLRRSLESLQPMPLLRQAVTSPLGGTLERTSLGVEGAPPVSVPAGWLVEPTAHPPVPGVVAPDAVVSWSPRNDFTVTLRCSWWRVLPMKPPDAAAAVMSGRGPAKYTDYDYAEDILGLSWVTAGSFVEAGPGLLLFGFRAPSEKVPFVSELFLQWVAANRSNVNATPGR